MPKAVNFVGGREKHVAPAGEPEMVVEGKQMCKHCGRCFGMCMRTT